MRRSHVFGVVPWQQLVDVRLFVSSSNGCEGAIQIAMWFNPVEFTGLDQGRDDGPVLCAREERVLSVESDGADRS